jgi:hypothetical protein
VRDRDKKKQNKNREGQETGAGTGTGTGTGTRIGIGGLDTGKVRDGNACNMVFAITSMRSKPCARLGLGRAEDPPPRASGTTVAQVVLRRAARGIESVRCCAGKGRKKKNPGQIKTLMSVKKVDLKTRCRLVTGHRGSQVERRRR